MMSILSCFWWEAAIAAFILACTAAVERECR